MKKLPLFLVLLLSFLTWWKLSLIPVRGDGFVYFIDNYNQAYFQKFLSNVFSFDWSAVVFGEILSNLFGTNMSMYGWTEVFFLLLTVAFFYWTILTITKNKLLAVSSSLIVGTSYYGNWDMYAGGIYPWFLERIPLMLLLLPSFTFLHLYFETRARKYFLYTFILFVLAIWISPWGILFSPVFVFYSIFWQKFHKKDDRKFEFLPPFIYLLICSVVIFLQKTTGKGVGPAWGLIDFITHPNTFNYFRDMVSQLVYWSTYFPFVDIVLGGFVESPIALFVSAKTSLFFTLPIIIIYCLALIYTYLKLPKFRALLLTVVASLFSILFLNAYLGQYHIPTQPGASRYLYLPTYLLSIFWSLFLLSAFWIQKKLFYVGHIALSFFFLINFWLIYENFNWNSESYQSSIKSWNVAVSLGSEAPDGSIVVIPNTQTGIYEAIFLTDQFKYKNIKFISDATDWQNEIGQNKVYKIEYDPACKCAKALEWKKTRK